MIFAKSQEGVWEKGEERRQDDLHWQELEPGGAYIWLHAVHGEELGLTEFRVSCGRAGLRRVDEAPSTFAGAWLLSWPGGSQAIWSWILVPFRAWRGCLGACMHGLHQIPANLQLRQKHCRANC